jgi:hypothetical protein
MDPNLLRRNVTFTSDEEEKAPNGIVSGGVHIKVAAPPGIAPQVFKGLVVCVLNGQRSAAEEAGLQMRRSTRGIKNSRSLESSERSRSFRHASN